MLCIQCVFSNNILWAFLFLRWLLQPDENLLGIYVSLCWLTIYSTYCWIVDGIKLRDLVDNGYRGLDKSSKVKAEDAGIDLAAEDPDEVKVETTKAVTSEETTTTPHPMPKAPQPHVQPDPDSKEKPLIPLSKDSMLFIGWKLRSISIKL